MSELIIDRADALPIKGQIQQWLQGEILNENFRVGDRIPSINKMAQSSGIARDTVRLALEDLVQQGWIIPEHGKGYFVKPRNERSHQIGILGKVDGVYMRQIYDHLHSNINDDSNILFIDSRQSLAAIRNGIKNLAYQHAVDRLLIVPPRGQEEQFSELVEPYRRYFSIAWLDRAPKDAVDASFVCDYKAVVELAFAHFADADVDTYLYFSRQAADGSVFSTMRDSFAQCLKSAGKSGHCVDSVDAAMAVMKDKKVAIISETDEEGLFLQNNIIGRGLKLGTDIQLISCDSSSLAQLAYPPLRSIAPGFAQIGEAIADWINAEGDACQFVAQPFLNEDASSV